LQIAAQGECATYNLSESVNLPKSRQGLRAAPGSDLCRAHRKADISQGVKQSLKKWLRVGIARAWMAAMFSFIIRPHRHCLASVAVFMELLSFS